MDEVEKAMMEAIQKRLDKHSLRTLKADNELVDFCSNDYLGFANSKELKELTEQLLSKLPYRNGATGSRLLSGNSDYVEALEKEIAQFHEADHGLIFNSGYDANIGLFSAVLRPGDTVFFDELIHASIWDGMRLSKATMIPFKHNDAADLAEKMLGVNGKKVIAVESIYSMDGDECPLKDFVKVAQLEKAALIVDEAHATGVVGKRGEGLVQKLGLQKEVFARVHTFGKALGGHGAIVLGNETLRTFLMNFARSFVFTTALPLPSLVSTKAAYQFLKEKNFTNQLHEKINLFKANIHPSIYENLIESNSSVQSVIIPDNERVRAVADYLQKHNFDIRAILFPSVPRGKERLRICIHAFNREEDILEMVKCLNDVVLEL